MKCTDLSFITEPLYKYISKKRTFPFDGDFMSVHTGHISFVEKKIQIQHEKGLGKLKLCCKTSIAGDAARCGTMAKDKNNKSIVERRWFEDEECLYVLYDERVQSGRGKCKERIDVANKM